MKVKYYCYVCLAESLAIDMSNRRASKGVKEPAVADK